MKTRKLPEITVADEQPSVQQPHENSSGSFPTDPLMSPLMKSIAARHDQIEGIDHFHREYAEDDGIIFAVFSPIREPLPPSSRRTSRARKKDRLNQQGITSSFAAPPIVKTKKNQRAESNKQSLTKP